jgi:hypothetical protein
MDDFQDWKEIGEVRPFVDDFQYLPWDSPGYMI